MSYGKSLSDVHESIDVQAPKSKWKKFLTFLGPAYLISVGYMDPGNWATDLAGGSAYGYSLIWVLLMSNIMALLLQSLSTRLGIVWGKDLAQCNRESYPKWLNFILYIFAELAIAACDLAEVLGMAIGLQLLFGLDLIWGVSISFLDTFLLLYLQKLGMRKMEAFIIGLVFLIGLSFLIEMFIAKPDIHGIIHGFVPAIPDKAALYISIGIIGATVMPHNLYLHSALVQTRKIKRDEASIRQALRYNFIDSAIALNLAFLVNAAILILAAAAFHRNGMTGVAELEDAHKLLQPTLGSVWAPRLFAVALILAGQSSTVTGTLAGQIVMEGYLQLRINPVVRRMMTRLLAIVPAILVILIAGDKEVGHMLIFSQVLLSMQLAFAVIPLIHFVSDKQRMGKFVIGNWVKLFSWLVASVIVVLNLQLVYEEILGWMQATDLLILDVLYVALGILIVVLLVMTVVYPFVLNNRHINAEVHPPFEQIGELHPLNFSRIAVALDYSESDVKTLQYALNIAKEKTHLTLIHIVESVSATVSGGDPNDYETRKDIERMKEYVHLLREKGFHVNYKIGFRDRVNEISRIVEEEKAELLVVGSHGHKGFKDLIYGETVKKLHDKVRVPVFIAK